MAYTYRLSRRLAQIHVAAFFLATLSCADSQAPVHDSTSANVAEYGFDSPSFVLATPTSVNIAHQPVGNTGISDRAMNAKIEGGWTDRGDAAFTISSQSSAPASPNSIGRAFFRKGYTGGNGPIQTDLNLRGKNRKGLYLSFWIKLSSSFYGAPTSGVNKVFHIWADGISTVVFAAYGQRTASLMPQLRLQNTEADPRGSAFNLNPNIVTTKNFARNTWYHVELQLEANTPGVANGKALWWIDGTLVGSYSNVGYLGAQDSPYWEQISWAPTWGTPSDKVPADMYMYMDHVYVSGHK